MVDDKDIQKDVMHNKILQLNNIGRTVDDIHQTLSEMGYTQSQLKDILSASFMETLLEKEGRFIDIEQEDVKHSAEQVEAYHEDVQEKIEEKKEEKERIEEESIQQHEEQVKNTKDNALAASDKYRQDYARRKTEEEIESDALIEQKKREEKAKEEVDKIYRTLY